MFGIFKLIGKVGKIQRAIAETKDVYEKGQSLAEKYKNVDDDAKAFYEEIQQAKTAWTDVF